MRLDEHIRGSVPHVRMHYVPNPCMHCDEAPCMASCPIEGALYKRDDGLVVIDTDKCTGCTMCVDKCPYHSIYFNDDLQLAQKCTGCAHLLDGGWEVPRCVDSCPTDALRFGEESEFADLIAQAEVMRPELGTRPRVYYLNVPKKFIAGTVYDPVEKEVVIGATVHGHARRRRRGQRPDRRVRRLLAQGPRDRRVRGEHRRRRVRHQGLRGRGHGEGRQPRRRPTLAVEEQQR